MDPPIFKRKKSRPSRQREAGADGAEDEAQAAPQDDSPMTLAAKLKNKHKARAKPQSRLSFEQEEGETFQVKKSELSRKLKLGGGVQLPSPAIPSTTASTGPSYTAAYLSELRASNSTPRATSHTREETLDIEATVAYNADELEAMGLDDDTIGGVVMPATSSILEAKKARERARITGISEATPRDEQEFISLSLTKRSEIVDDGPHPESRLMREEDDLGEGDDDLAEYTGAKDRIALGKKARKAETKQKRADMIELIENADEDDEETREWQSAQVRRNVAEEPKELAPKIYKPAPIPAPTPIPTLTSSIASLTMRLTALTTSHTKNAASLETLGDERAALAVKEQQLRKMVEETEAKRSWFNDFRQWMDSLCDLLDAKFPILEKLEDEHVSLLTERAGMVNKRRAADDEDDLSLFVTLPEPVGAMEETDDLGRIIPTGSGPQSGVRRARRGARNQRRSSRQTNSTDDAGYSTDSSLPSSDAIDFQSAIDSLKARIHALLEDVKAKDFRDPKHGIAKRFAQWREKFPDSYQNAWGGLGVVGAWEFWARLEMVGWDPLEELRSLDSFAWYSSLYEYSRPSPGRSESMELDDEPEEPPIAPEGDLAASMVSTAVLPRLVKLVGGGAFDPYSARHVRRLVDLAEQAEISVAKEDHKFQALVREVVQVFSAAARATQEQASTCIGPTATPAPFQPDAPAARKQYLMKRYKLLSNMVQWRKYTGERFGIGEIMAKLLQGVVIPVAQDGWEVGGSSVIERVKKILPPDVVVDGI